MMAQLQVSPLPDCRQIEAAACDVWLHAGMQRPDSDAVPGDPAHDGSDPLLALARQAADWALAALNEVRGDLREAGVTRVGSAVRLWVGFHRPDISRAAVQLALWAWGQRLQPGVWQPNRLQAELARLWQVCRSHHPDYQARILRVGARAMDVPFLPFLVGSRYWQFGWGAKARVFMESSSNADGALGAQWQKSKPTTKALLKALGLPTPAHALVMHEEELPAAMKRVGLPCVVKPLDRGGGKGVTANIRSLPEAQAAFQAVRSLSQGAVLVEAHVAGDDHRIMVIDGVLAAVIRREPSFVVGDGVTPLSVLITRLNAPRSSNMVRSQYLRPIALDEVLHRHVATQGLSLGGVPAQGQRVTLRSNANLSTGGMCTDVTAMCHPQVRAMAELLAKTSGLAAVGIDYLTTDITLPPSVTGGTFIEMNTTPGLDACIAAGWPQTKIARMVLGTSVGRIPVELTVLDAAGMQELRAGLDPLPVPEGLAIVVDNTLYLGNLVLRFSVSASEPWPAVHAALRYRCVTHLRVICTAEALMQIGSPLDQFHQVRIALRDGQPVLPPQWITVLARQTPSNVVRLPAADIVQRLLRHWDKNPERVQYGSMT